MTKTQLTRLHREFDRLLDEMPADVAEIALSNFGVMASRVPPQFRLAAERLREIAARIANDNA